jgi:hypothetical protein
LAEFKSATEQKLRLPEASANKQLSRKVHSLPSPLSFLDNSSGKNNWDGDVYRDKYGIPGSDAIDAVVGGSAKTQQTVKVGPNGHGSIPELNQPANLTHMFINGLE